MPNREITIRMYNVGFGDAFLVTLPMPQGERRLLFDCGSIAKGPSSIGEVANQIVADCTNGSADPRIDVVVATHRHRDHVSGFALPLWNSVDVGEVWLPWTEDPTNPEARRIRDAQAGLTNALTAALAATGTLLTGMAADAEGPAVRLDPLAELAFNALSNEPAMRMLHSGFKGSPRKRFLPEVDKQTGKSVRSFVSEALPGVTVHVLGPSRSEEVIRDMDPPSGKSYLRLREERKLPTDMATEPFGGEFAVASVPPSFSEDFKPEEIEQLEKGFDLSDFDAAVALDKAVNGTSLMLVLEIGGKYLLFPGDAQWGTWEAVLNDAEWRDLLKRTTFYKVGHHGSHNATPIDFVEHTIGHDVVAMVSTIERSIWPNIPREPLLEALIRQKAKIARSDREDDLDAIFTVARPHCIETRIRL